MFDYDKSAATALRLIRNFGTTLTLTRNTVTPNGPAGTVSTVTTTGSLDAVVLTASKGTVEAFDDRLREDMIQGKIRFVIAAASTATIVPQANDIVAIGSDNWRILGMTPLSPAGTPVIYKFGCARV